MLINYFRPKQLSDAVARNSPVLIPAGVMEFHGPHLPLGTDYLIASAICEQIAQRCECILVPGLPFGPTMSWAAGPDEGEVDFEPEPFFQYTLTLFRHLLKLGFRRIYVLQHHQGHEGLQSLCLQRAAREAIWEMSKTFPTGWGRPPIPPEPAIFSCIQIAELDSFSIYPDFEAPRVPVGHGGKGETQLMMAAYPNLVCMDALADWQGPLPEWLEDAHEARLEDGQRWMDFCINGWVSELQKE
jgi:creatinine amidohydrolase